LEEYSQGTNSTFSTLEYLMRQDMSISQEKYVKLSNLLQTLQQKNFVHKATTSPIVLSFYSL
jgi:hypothetical protein